MIVTRDHERVYADTSNNRGKHKIVVARHDLAPHANYRAVAKGEEDHLLLSSGRVSP